MRGGGELMRGTALRLRALRRTLKEYIEALPYSVYRLAQYIRC